MPFSFITSDYFLTNQPADKVEFYQQWQFSHWCFISCQLHSNGKPSIV